MTYTDIYPIYEKMKYDGHVIFHKGGTEHLCRDDYYNLQVTNLIEKLKCDIQQMVSLTDRNADEFVRINRENMMERVNCAPNSLTNLVIIKFEGYKYLLVKSKELYILMNYAPENDDICKLDIDNQWNILPQGGRCERTIFQLREQYAKYVVNTYTAFCSFCDSYLKVRKNELRADYNRSFRNVLVTLFNTITFPDSESDCIYRTQLNNRTVSFRLIKIYNVIIVVDWLEEI